MLRINARKIVNILILLTLVLEFSQSEDLDYRLGLLGPSLGLNPTGGFLGEDSDQYDEYAFDNESEYFDSEPLASLTDPFIESQQCCCFPVSQLCPDPFGTNTDLILLGVLNSSTPASDHLDVSPQGGLVFRFAPLELISTTDCHGSQRSCCYDLDIDLENFSITCLSSAQSQEVDPWIPGCDETELDDVCGQRDFIDLTSKSDEESSPGEFPWTCLILTAQNGFVGNCVLIPDEAESRGSRKVITAAHKLNFVNTSNLKIRLGEFDAAGFISSEKEVHIEVDVETVVKHPQFSEKRFSHDVAVLMLSRSVDISEEKFNINTPCFPSCAEQFSHQFVNNTGTNCWMSGWKVDRDSRTFIPRQHKEQLSLVSQPRCEEMLSSALAARDPSLGEIFSLDQSEICAGHGSQQDVCKADGGAPLVCEAPSGRWTLVGMMTWTLGCDGGDNQTPGVFLHIANVLDWITSVH